MSEEKVTILRMLAEGKISVEEAETLLKALGDDEAPQGESGHATRRGRSVRAGDFGEILGEIGQEVRRAVAAVQGGEMGHVVRREIDEAVHRVQRMDMGRMVDKVVDQVRDVIDEVVEHASIGREEAVEDCEWTLDSKALLAIHAATDSGDVRFTAGPQDGITVTVHKKVKAHSRAEAVALIGQVQVDVLRDGDVVRIDKQHMPLPKGHSVEVSYTIEGPAGIDLELCAVNGQVEARGSQAAVRAQTTNGNLRVDGVRGAAHLRTQNGNIIARIDALHEEGLFSTQNGNIHAHIAAGDAALTVSSTNGQLEVHLPDAYPARIDARTTNGSVDSMLPMHRVELAKRTQLIGQLGTEANGVIRLHTLNGNIRLKPLEQCSDEPAVERGHGQHSTDQGD